MSFKINEEFKKKFIERKERQELQKCKYVKLFKYRTNNFIKFTFVCSEE